MSVFAVDGTVKVIYETKKLRSTGAHTRVWDRRPEGGTFEIECVTHGRKHVHNVRLEAEEMSHRSWMWCDLCVIPEAGKEKLVNAASRKHGTVVSVNAMPDSAQKNERKYVGMAGDLGYDAGATPTWNDPRRIVFLAEDEKVTKARRR